MNRIGQSKVYDTLNALGITFDYLEHPAAPTIEIAKQYWTNLESTHCKNLFFRNHKGNRHYLVIFDCDQNLAIHDLEHLLKQGKLSFASEKRMVKYLGLYPGSVSPFHPNDNRASIAIKTEDFIRYMNATGNGYEWIKLYGEKEG